MSERIHFKLTFNGELYRFDSSADNKDMLRLLIDNIASTVNVAAFELYWRDEDSNVVLETNEDLATAIDFARHSSEDPSASPCVQLVIEESQGESQTAASNEHEATSSAAASTQPREEWTVEDDVRLMYCVNHVGDIEFISKMVKLSKKFTKAQMEKRWFDLMYDEEVNKYAKRRFKQCSPEYIDTLQTNIPLSLEENFALKELMAPNADVDEVERVLNDNRGCFHHVRTAQELLEQMAIMKLSESGPAKPRAPLDVKTSPTKTPTAVSSTDGRAYLKGKYSSYPINRDRIILGRSTSSSKVDVDLSQEGPINTIARKQAVVSRNSSNEFTITNMGRRPIRVDGTFLFENSYTIITHNAIIEIAHVKLVFKC